APAAPDVEKARAARSANELPSGGGEEIAADLGDVDRHLTNRLGRVEEEEDTGLAGHPPAPRGRVGETAARRHMRQRDELHVVVDACAKFVEVDLAVGVVADHDDLCTRSAC